MMTGSGELETTEAVFVPCEVAGLVKPVAAAMVVQKVIGDMLGSPLHNPGLAYEAVRHISPEVAAQCRALNRASNIAKHGVQRGGRKNTSAPAASTEAQEEAAAQTKQGYVKPRTG